MNLPYLRIHPITGMYEYRRVVPPDLRAVVGKGEIKRSLKTRDPKEARQRGMVVSVEIDALLEGAKNRHGLLTEGEKDQFREGIEKVVVAALAEHGTSLPDVFANVIMQHFAQRDLSALTASLGRLGAERGIPAGAAKVELLDLMRGSLVALTPKIVLAPQGLRLDSLLAKWKAERQPGLILSEQMDQIVRRLRESTNDAPVRSLTKDDLITYKDQMLAMPRSLTKEERREPLATILARYEGQSVARISRATVVRMLGMASVLFAYGVDNNFLDDNPASGVKVAAAKMQEQKRLPFDSSELAVIAKAGVSFADHRKWLFLLGLYSGARLEELGQLLVSDVGCEDGIHYLDINAVEDGKHLKTRGSTRRVPLHQAVIDAGFLDYVATLKTTSLFPALNRNRRGKLTEWFGRWFGNHLDRLGISDSRKTFHSLRHTFKQGCRRAGMMEEVSDALTGHINGSVGRTYGNGMKKEILILHEAINRISYPNLQLS